MSPTLSHLALLMASTPKAAAASAPTADASVDVVAIGADAMAAPVSTGATATIDARTNALPQGAHAKTAFAQVGAPAPMPQAASSAGSIGGALFALVLVIGLILLLGWLAKRMPGFGGTRNNSALRVVGSLALGPRERVVVVAVGDTQLLLGVGSGGTRTLHTLETPLPSESEVKTTPAFAQLLAQHFGKKA
jgi:flagellar protein FliO/FliZ